MARGRKEIVWLYWSASIGRERASEMIRDEFRARRQCLRDSPRFEDTPQLANSPIFELHGAIQPLPGSAAASKLQSSLALARSRLLGSLTVLALHPMIYP
jgi:hypothetical protein